MKKVLKTSKKKKTTMLLTPKIINEDILCYDEMRHSLNTGKNN